jgi:hypothetical protein
MHAAEDLRASATARPLLELWPYHRTSGNPAMARTTIKATYSLAP